MAVALASGASPDAARAHVAVGWALAGLLAFRLAWGFVGGRYSRWTAFPLRARDPVGPGHPRSGAWSAAVVLLLLAGITLTGVVVLGAEEGRGPLAGFGSAALGVDVHEVHGALAWAVPARLRGAPRRGEPHPLRRLPPRRRHRRLRHRVPRRPRPPHPPLLPE